MAPPKQTQFTNVATVVRAQPTQSTLHTASVVKHLLWHKAMVGDEEDGKRITDYIDLVTHADDGEHISLPEGFSRDIAIAFELVTQNHLDPWDLDLSKFAEMYLKEAKERGVDIVTAGRIILMAWTVLKLQSDEVASKAVIRSEEPTEMGWDDIPDYGFSDSQMDFNDRIFALPKAPIDEKIRHKGDRRVTLMELLNAFEEVHTEAQQRLELNEMKLAARLQLRRRMRGRIGGMMHTEDVQAEMAETWTRILDYPAMPVPFSSLFERQPMDLVQTFASVLALTKAGRIEVVQPEFPRGEIWITPRLAEAAAVITEEVTQ